MLQDLQPHEVLLNLRFLAAKRGIEVGEEPTPTPTSATPKPVAPQRQKPKHRITFG